MDLFLMDLFNLTRQERMALHLYRYVYNDQGDLRTLRIRTVHKCRWGCLRTEPEATFLDLEQHEDVSLGMAKRLGGHPVDYCPPIAP